MATFQELLKDTMKSKGHDVTAAAQAIPGVSDVQIKGYLDGRFPNSRNDALANVAAYIGVTADDIVAMKPGRAKKAGAKKAGAKKAGAKKTGAKKAGAKKAAGAKRGPGRPPKQPVAAGAAEAAPAKRGRGRPPKSAAAKTSTSTRGPGRPRKSATAKRGAGRPRAAAAPATAPSSAMATLNVFGAEIRFGDLSELKSYIDGEFGEISLTIMGKKKAFKSLAEVTAFVKEFEKLFK
jgi:hypothetical protein